mmetsp:Transcript_59972/g.123103  ORF Transcript_59972/g.123103 Transcript_59972/m.123103 type:complete len:266 (-) Transcript_59972:749-1546(-)
MPHTAASREDAGAAEEAGTRYRTVLSFCGLAEVDRALGAHSRAPPRQLTRRACRRACSLLHSRPVDLLEVGVCKLVLHRDHVQQRACLPCGIALSALLPAVAHSLCSELPLLVPPLKEVDTAVAFGGASPRSCQHQRAVPHYLSLCGGDAVEAEAAQVTQHLFVRSQHVLHVAWLHFVRHACTMQLLCLSVAADDAAQLQSVVLLCDVAERNHAFLDHVLLSEHSIVRPCCRQRFASSGRFSMHVNHLFATLRPAVMMNRPNAVA